MAHDEWLHKYNCFNSDKAMCWRDRFEDIMKGIIPKPVTVSLDISNKCNISCNFCHYSKFRNEKPVLAEWSEIEWLCNEALPKWRDMPPKPGPLSVCCAGGGEFLCHPKASDTILLLKKNNFRVGLITNGVNTNHHMDAILNCLDWIGFSVDCSDPETYKQIKGGSHTDFYRVLDNMKNIVQNRKDGRPTVTFKFLLTPDNYTEVRDACKLSKSLGLNNFHIRPALLQGIQWYPDQIAEIKILIERCMALDSPTFHVYGITHKFNPDFTKRVIPRCEVTPIAGTTFTADGKIFNCCDLRDIPMGYMCTWREILDYWGSSQHQEMLKKVDPKLCPRRCTYSSQQIILEEVFRKNCMDYCFP